MWKLLSAALLALTVPATEASAQRLLAAVGRVERLLPAAGNAQGRVTLQRGARKGLTAAPPILLFPGDVLRSEKGGRARLRIRGRAVTVGPQMPSYTVPDSASVFDQLDEQFAQLYHAIFAADKGDPPQFPLGRSKDEPPPAPIRADPLLPEGRQLMPPGATRAAVIWRDGAANVLVTSAGRQVTIPSDGFSFAQVPLPDAGARIEATGGGRTLRWTVERGGAPPGPAWQAGAGPGLSARQRLVRALWLLRVGPDEWYLFALTELADLNLARDVLGEEAWTAAITVGLGDSGRGQDRR
jgi:hypothetical protein